MRHYFDDFIDRIAPKIVCRDCASPLSECGIEGLYCERCLRYGPLPAEHNPEQSRLLRRLRRIAIILALVCGTFAVLAFVTGDRP